MCNRILYADVVEPYQQRAFDAAIDMLFVDYAKHKQADGNPYTPEGEELGNVLETFYMVQNELHAAIARGAPEQNIRSIDEQWVEYFNRVRELGIALRLRYLAYLPVWNATCH